MNALCKAIADKVASYPSKRQAALAIGTSPQNLDNWLLGRVPSINAQLQRDLADFLEVTPRQILVMLGFDIGGEGDVASRQTGPSYTVSTGRGHSTVNRSGRARAA